jgi:hypothetical protein
LVLLQKGRDVRFVAQVGDFQLRATPGDISRRQGSARESLEQLAGIRAVTLRGQILKTEGGIILELRPWFSNVM